MGRSAIGGGVEIIAREGEPLYEGGTFGIPFVRPSINSRGEVVFGARLSVGLGEAIYRLSDSGIRRRVAATFESVPNGNGTYADLADFSRNRPAINNSGDVAFWADLANTAGGASDDNALFLDPALGPLEEVARERVKPFRRAVENLWSSRGSRGTRREDWCSWRRSSSRWSWERNGGSTATRKVSCEKLLRTRDVVAPGGGSPVTIGTIIFARPQAQDGLVLFHALVGGTPGGSADDYRVFVLRPDGKVNLVAAEGASPPDGGGTYADPEYPLELYDSYLNRFGQVAFESRLEGTPKGTEDDFAIYLHTPGSPTRKIVRKGEILDGKVISELSLRDFNDTGLILFSASFTDGSEALYIYHPFSINRYTALTDGAWDDDAHWSVGLSPRFRNSTRGSSRPSPRW